MGRADPPPVRFFAKITIDPGGCWFWDGARTNGYGQFWDGDRLVRAHRWSYEHFIGPIWPGLQLDHLCRVRHCVYPAHLEAVTAQINTLRGEGPPAIHARKTYCKHGHPFDAENTYLYHGHRQCRTCRRDRRIGNTNRKEAAG